MSPRNDRRTEPGGAGGDVRLLWVGIVGVFLLLGGTNLGARVGLAATGAKHGPLDDPWAVMFGVFSGAIPWPWQSSAVLLLVAIALAAAAWAGIRLRRVRAATRSRVDDAARYLGRGQDIAGLGREAVTRSASRLGVSASSPGITIGRTISQRQTLWGSWEDMHIDVWGPRTGKTTSRAIPALLDAPGAALSTSNKRDLLDATRDVRAQLGQVWVFDPQQCAFEPASWWWNPLSSVVDDQSAARLAVHFASGSRDIGARRDPFFDVRAENLLADLLLGAALGRRPISEVFTWLTRPNSLDQVADQLLSDGYPLQADRVNAVLNSADKERSGVLSTAQNYVACLASPAILQWIERQGSFDRRPEFDPATFIQGQRDTLYSLSREGQGTAGPLVTALTVAVVEAAERLASRSPGGRLSVPLVGVLDEAANVCRWRDLPANYSHFGSRGIVLMTFLQAWSQGVEVWGEAGMKRLWSSANVKVLGGGVDERDFLTHLSDVIGDYDRVAKSQSVTGGKRTISRQLQRDKILSVAELASLPKGRAVVFASGQRPTLVETIPWMQSPMAAAVAASIAAHDPQARSVEGGMR